MSSSTASSPSHITIIGYGNMGRALLDSWLANNDIDTYFYIVDPHNTPPDHQCVSHSATINQKNAQSEIIVLAIKPQIMDEVCGNLKEHLNPESLIISIAAGQSIAALEGQLGADQPIARIMPNTPAAIGKGMSVGCINQKTSTQQQSWANQLFECTGLIKWINDEYLMDAVTALSGSGPAYLFHMIESLAHAGVQSGLPENLAATLARQTIIGSAALAEANPDTPIKALRQNVTSPKGTTEAGLSILMNGELQEILDRTIAAATARSKELGD